MPSLRQRYRAVPGAGDVQQSMSTEKKLAVVGVAGMSIGVMGLSFILVAVSLAATLKLEKSKDPKEVNDQISTLKGCLGTVVAVGAAGFVVALVVTCLARARLIGHYKRFARSDHQHYLKMKQRFQPQFNQ